MNHRQRLDQLWRDTWKAPDRSPPWEWAQRHIKAIPYSPVPGRFRVENSPWIREVMEAITDSTVRHVCVLAAVQSSKTTAAELCLCYVIANLPGPTLWLNETDDDAKDQSESRLQKLFDECPPVRALYPANRHRKRNRTIHFSNGMPLWVTGAHNKTNLQRRSIRWVFADECWNYPPGHMAEAEARVTAFGWLGKCVWMSQGGQEDDDFHRKFLATDQREWTFACPKCGHRQPFQWECIEWSKSAKDENGEWDYAEVQRTTALRCQSCNQYFDDTDRTRRELNLAGRFVPLNPKASKENVGFHWNALCAMSWGQLAEFYLRAKAAARKGDLSLLQQFYQKRLGLPWREYVEDYKLEITKSGYRMGEVWDQEGGIDRQGHLLTPPFPANATIIPLRFLTVDVQMDHFFYIVRAWTPQGSSRLMWCERVTTWEDIDAAQERFSIHSNLVFVDANYASFEVYRQCSERGWTALIGDSRATFTHRHPNRRSVQRFYSPRHKVVIGRGRHCYVHRFSNLNVKDCLARLRRNQDPAKGSTWEVPDDVPEEYLAQMESEHRVKDGNKWIWKQIGNRPNHWFDADVEQTCAALMLKVIGAESVIGVVDAATGDDTPTEAC